MDCQCLTCESPRRRLWSWKRKPPLTEIAAENWMALLKCPDCGQLWCEVPHEPYASFLFWTAWPSTEEQWRRLIQIDQGRILHDWHDAVLREDHALLEGEEKEAVAFWRERTYRHYNPIDRSPEFSKPKYCSTSKDIEKYVEQGG